ncbi:MAG TPA: transcription antitermination factor NusB [Salinimicrobium sp.]|nr:transcription antitermination factor NusB [Salinimicrobium sp.]
MLTRRHIRVKVMQSLYAYNQSQNDNLKVEEKFLLKSMEEMYDLFLLLLSLPVELKKLSEAYMEKSSLKFLPTQEDKDPNRKFLNNEAINLLDNNIYLNAALEERKLNNWSKDDDYVQIVWKDLLSSDLYAEYMQTRNSSFIEDKEFLISIYKEIIAPNEKLYEYFEDRKLTWLDDLPLVNTAILKMFNKMKPDSQKQLTGLFKNHEDKEFAVDLFRKSLLKDRELFSEIEGKTPNWDQERIAEIDAVLLKMAICEFLYFPSIPVKVTINEYLEIAKEYSTPKSSIFINGILDKLSKQYQEENKLNKMGRGLL